MKDVHVNMKVGEAPFVKLMELLGESLKENGVSADLT